MTKKRCLVFGGNGFLGFETVTQLLNICEKERSEVDLTLLHRGQSWEWGRKELLSPTVRIITLDRDRPLSECGALQQFVSDVEGFDTVLDFSGYDARAVEEAVQLLCGKTVGLYVYISTDSVYEVCHQQIQGNPSQEEDAVRPRDPALKRQLSKRDKYGSKKLDGEEVLRAQRHKGGFPWTALRLADVVGARDSTHRLLQYQLWIRLASVCAIPVLIPSSLKARPISLVYATDVAKLVAQLVFTSSTRQNCIDQAFNLAFTDQPNLTVNDLLNIIQERLCLRHVVYKYSDSNTVPQIYPSVDYGPIATDKARSVLQWSPTPLTQAIAYTVTFYEDAISSQLYTQEMKEAASMLLEDMEDLFDNITIKTMRGKLKQWKIFSDDNENK